MKFWICVVIYLVPFYSFAEKSACLKKFPKLSKTIVAISPLQNPGKLSFKEAVQKIKIAENVANGELEAIRMIGCRGESSAEIEACLRPLLWGCESVEALIDKTILSKLSKTKIEEKALLTGQLGEK